jgi:hypothetical protein
LWKAALTRLPGKPAACGPSQLQADAISHLIVNTDLPWIDVSIQIEQLREEARRLWPQQSELFDLIYQSRFDRLWQQWHKAG